MIHGEAWQSLANLKTYKFEDGEVLEWRASSRSGLGKWIGSICTSVWARPMRTSANTTKLSNYASGNQIKRDESRYIAEHMSRVRTTRRVFDTLAPSRDGFEAPDPIFIVGMPSWVHAAEQILSSHSQVDGTQNFATSYPPFISCVLATKTLTGSTTPAR